MTKTATGTLVIIHIGYDKYVAPPGTSADTLSILTKATKIDEYHIDGANHLIKNIKDKRTIDINIVDEKMLVNFIDNRKDHEEYDIIVENVQERLCGKKHVPLVFDFNIITVGKHRLNYVDLANPETDPEEIINDIVKKALEF